MSVTATIRHSIVSNLRLRAAVGVIAMGLAAVVSILLFSTDEALNGSMLERLAIPLRMLILVLIASFLLRLTNDNWRSVGLRRPASLGRVALLVIGGYVAIGAAYSILSAVLLPALGITPQTAKSFAGLVGNTGLYLYLLLLVAWGSAGIGEELVFRGFLQSRLEKLFGPARGSVALAILAQAVFFGALHLYQGLGGAILAGSTALVIGIVYVAGRRNLWACILLHGLVDTISLTAIYLGAVPV